MTKLKIGIYGSAADERGEVIAKAVELGKVLGQYKDKIILITGASAGIPHVIVNEASKYGVEIWGYSPEIDLDSQKKKKKKKKKNTQRRGRMKKTPHFFLKERIKIRR